MTPTHPAYGQVRQVTPTAAALLADNPGPMTLDGTNTWILRAPGRSECVVIDPGPDQAEHIDGIVAATSRNVALTLITHRHPDHTDGIDPLVRATGTPVRAMDEAYTRSGVALQDGEVLEVAGLRITAVHTPGHTGDSMSFVLDDAVLTGDTILGRGTTVLDPSDGGLGDYLRSLDRLLAVGAGRALLPAHGSDHPDLEPVAQYYVAHRHERLDQVRAALRELGPDADAMAVVREVYADVDKNLWPAARSSVQAQLEYLRADS